jgi:hypothetical protein
LRAASNGGQRLEAAIFESHGGRGDPESSATPGEIIITVV